MKYKCEFCGTPYNTLAEADGCVEHRGVWHGDMTPLEKEIELTKMKIRMARKWQDDDRILGETFGYTKSTCMALRRHRDMKESNGDKLKKLFREAD